MNVIKKAFARISDKSQGVVIAMAKPLIKKFVAKAVVEYKDEVMDFLKKVDIPKMTKKEEKAFWSKLYDNVTQAFLKIVDRM